ncbi:vitamin D3 hydroxylase-associated protein-like isoform X3 [Rhinatrema bivittatum]|uniref:vitamin D3 hydroxylase-associated protein-like isoform X3 n=1 Tax=Rhinatrema bivittatum TaxID=194408 RepID=UPI00112A560F|nr:vitamin D3 hydroxylase-associated protein-like isoform X3 [Rhinatrema bivittatum]
MVPERLSQLLPQTELHPRILSALVCGSAAALLLLKWLQRRRLQQKLEEARRKRDRALIQMEKFSLQFKQQNPGIQPDAILSLTLVELAEKLKEGSLSPESVLCSYMGKALEVNKDVNCLTDFLPECVAQLQEVKKQEKKGPLYGIPVSIKEHYNYKGHDSPCGLAYFLGVLAQEDSVIVQVLKEQGAIPFVKTNVPQSMFSFACSNPIFGQTLNPHNHRKTTGGSSSGEGALIAGGGSILGFGSDIGGSIRVPSSFCGICGIKPTDHRLSIGGITAPVYGIKSVHPAIGPMARDVDSLALCMKALLCDHMFRLDPSVPPIPFRDEVFSSTEPLRIGYYDTDGFVLPPPCMRRAVRETGKLLEEAGHTLIPFRPLRMEHLVNEVFLKGIFADGASMLLEKFQGDLVDPSLKPQISVYKLPWLVKRILALVLRPVFPRIANELNALCGVGSAGNLWKQHVAAQEYCQDFIDEWKRLRLDVVLCPVMGPAYNFGYLGRIITTGTYTYLYNVLNFPAGVVTVSTVTEEDEEELKHYKGHYNDHWDKLIKKAAEGGVGLPVAVQCVALPWQEELCLRFMKEVERLTWEKREME